MANKHETWRWSFICPVVVMKRGICSQHLPTNVSKVFVKMVGENNKRAREKGEADTSVVWTDWHDDWRAVPISSGHLMFLQTAGKKVDIYFTTTLFRSKRKKKLIPVGKFHRLSTCRRHRVLLFHFLPKTTKIRFISLQSSRRIKRSLNSLSTSFLQAF